MFAKIEITGTIEVVTGMHIGGSSAFSAIGAVDSPVIKDMRTGYPIIPGSSLKGKMRSLLAKRYNTVFATTPDDDAECLTSLFGSAKKGNVRTGRLLFSDMLLGNWEELKKQGLTSKTEIKFENTIKRTTAVANPRQIERVVPGVKFGVRIVYDVVNPDEITEDMEQLAHAMRLLQLDYLGGHGSRGSGRVSLSGFSFEQVESDFPQEQLKAIFDKVDQYELLPV